LDARTDGFVVSKGVEGIYSFFYQQVLNLSLAVLHTVEQTVCLCRGHPSTAESILGGDTVQEDAVHAIFEYGIHGRQRKLGPG
jgi:hypothetical protein